MNDDSKISLISRLVTLFFLAAFLSDIMIVTYLITFPRTISATFIRINHRHTSRMFHYTDRASMTSAMPWTEKRLPRLLLLLTSILTIQSEHSIGAVEDGSVEPTTVVFLNKRREFPSQLVLALYSGSINTVTDQYNYA